MHAGTYKNIKNLKFVHSHNLVKINLTKLFNYVNQLMLFISKTVNKNRQDLITATLHSEFRGMEEVRAVRALKPSHGKHYRVEYTHVTKRFSDSQI